VFIIIVTIFIFVVIPFGFKLLNVATDVPTLIVNSVGDATGVASQSKILP
jgi:hypothetical protein